MTRTEPAQKVGVTDQVISQWERDLSCPDRASVNKLAAVPDISAEELTPSSTDLSVTTKDRKKSGKTLQAFRTVAVSVALAMGVAVTVLSKMGDITVMSGMTLPGIGLALPALGSLPNSK